MAGIVIAVVGTRDYNDYAFFCNIMDRRLEKLGIKIKKFISGGAPGIDDMIEDYAAERGYDFERYDADWKRDGNAAGFIRNTTLVTKAEEIWAFWDKESSGTSDTIQKAMDAHKRVRVTAITKSPKRYYCKRKLAEWNEQRKQKALSSLGE